MSMFAKTLDAIMTRRRLTNTDLASKIGSTRVKGSISLAHLGRLRNGKKPPGPHTLDRLCSYFGGKDAEELRAAFDRDETPPSMLAQLATLAGHPGDGLDAAVATLRQKLDGKQLDALLSILREIDRDPTFWLAAIDGMVRYEYSRRPRNGNNKP